MCGLCLVAARAVCWRPRPASLARDNIFWLLKFQGSRLVAYLYQHKGPTFLPIQLSTGSYTQKAGLSVRAGGGGFLPAIRVWCAGYEHRRKADIKSQKLKYQNRSNGSRDAGNWNLACFYLNFWSFRGLCPLEPHSIVQFIHKWWPRGTQAWTFWPVVFMTGSSVWVHSHLLMHIHLSFCWSLTHICN